MRSTPTQAELKAQYSYDSDTGQFTALRDELDGRWKAGRIAGTTSGRNQIRLNGQMRRAHRLAWLYVYGEWPDQKYQIDHINGDPSDNRICNLRKATPAQNQANSRRPKNNTTGFKGVTFDKKSGVYRAKIMVNYKTVHLGGFSTAEKAHEAYVKAANEFYGPFARAA